MRSPFARLSAIASRIILTASSASFATSCGNCAASLSISSDFVIAPPALLVRLGVRLVVHLGPQQGAEIRGSGARARGIGLDVLDGLRLLGVILRLDREIDAAVLPIDVDDHR